MQYWAWRGTSTLLRAAPRGLAYRIATLVGRLAFWAWPGGRQATTRNFRVVLGPGVSAPAVRATARRSLERYCRYLADFARLEREATSERGLVVQDAAVFDQLRELHARYGGVIIATMHFGDWDAGAVATAQAGFPVTAVADDFGDKRLDALVLGSRERLGVEIVRASSGALGAVRALQRGRLVALVVDRPLATGGITVSFFGRPVRVPAGAARLALRTGSPIVAAACYRTRSEPSRLRLWADFTLPLPNEVHGPEAARSLTQSLFAAHERIIRRRPADWYMFRAMWP